MEFCKDLSYQGRRNSADVKDFQGFLSKTVLITGVVSARTYSLLQKEDLRCFTSGVIVPLTMALKICLSPLGKASHISMCF